MLVTTCLSLSVQVIRYIVNLAVEGGVYLKAGVMEDGEHWFIARQDFGEEAFDAALFGDFRDIIEQVGSHAFLLPFVLDDEGDFGGLGLGVEEVLGDSDDVLLAGGARDDADDGDILLVIDIGQLLDVLVREGHRVGHIACLDGLFAEGVEHFRQLVLVGGLDGPEEDFRAVAEGVVVFKLVGVSDLGPVQLDLVLVDIFLRFGGLDEPGPEFGMGDVDEVEDPFADALAVQVGDAVFGDDVMDVAAGGDDACAFGEVRDDSADLACAGGGGHSDDGLAAPAAGGAADEIDLAADAAVELVAERIGADLAGEVDFEADVDGDHFFVLADEVGVVDVFGGVEFEEGVVVDVVVEASRAHTEAGDDFAVVDGFFAQVMAPHSIRSIIQSLNISVWMPRSFLSLRYSARACGMRPMPHSMVQPSSTRRAMFSPMRRRTFVGFRDGDFDDVLVKGDETIDGVDVDEAVAEGAGHTGVDLGDDVFGVGGGGLDDIDGDAEAAQAVDVGRGDGDQAPRREGFCRFRIRRGFRTGRSGYSRRCPC